LEGITRIDEARSVLKDELERYNHHQVHSTTGEIPRIRFEKALKAGNNLFSTVCLAQAFIHLPKDVFACV
jgi:hypothetical protein